jgi:hypothetical protein
LHCLTLAVLATTTQAAFIPDTLLYSLFNPLNSQPHGNSVAISGSRVVVGSSSTNAYVYDLASANPYQPAILTYPNPQPGDQFGDAVAISGQRVAVGSPGSGQGPNLAGRVFVYHLTNPSPTVLITTLTNSSPGLHESAMGISVALAGSRVVAGAWQGNIGSLPRGAVHVFDLDSTTPTVPVAILTNPGPASSTAYGVSVAASGNRVVVGSPGDRTGAQYSGCTHVYDFAGGTPTLPLLTLTNPTPAVSDNFGSSVAISGNRVVVSAALDDTSAFDSGIAYVYDLASPTPATPVLTLTNPSLASSDFFGSSVGISGNLVVVGAYGNDTGAYGAGIAYVFNLTSPTPRVPVATLTSPDPKEFGSFGRYAAIDGVTVAIAPGVYVFGPRPVLSIAPAAPGFVSVSWTPTNSYGFTLQFAPSIAPVNWLNAPTGPANPVLIPTTSTAQFYRLINH